MLEKEVAAHPYNFPALLALVETYGPRRTNESMNVLDASRAALKDDPDRLYFIAHLYTRIDQPRLSEQVLEDVLRADPSFAAAANDLGYTLADSDRDLDRAETLIRRAVEVEPSNPMFLDSLGWVLYKRGQIGEARRFLEQAVAGARAADPVVLDHLGDALYRLNEQDLARRNWELAQSRIPEAADRQDHNTLKLKLQQKLKQLEQHQPVSVAPSTHAAPAGQAKN
jgi:tetratricopeptide (TPR) repeat protein